MKKLGIAIVAVFMAFAMIFAGCTAAPAGQEPTEPESKSPEESQAGQESASGDDQKKLTIGFSNWSRSFEFYVDMEAGMQEKADELGVELIIQDANGDLNEQTKQLENFVSRGVDGIVICPIDSEASGTEVQMVNSAGIPIATADIECTGGGDVVTHIASNNYLGGQLAAHFIGDALGGKGTVAVIDNPTITPLIDRENGFLETIEKEYPDIEIVAVQSGESTREKGMEVAENLLEKYPDLGGIFGTNDMMALGALQAVEAKNKETVIVGFDASEEACNAIKSGSPMKASIAQQPKLLGAQVLEALVNHIHGEQVEEKVEVEVIAVSAENVDEYLK